jgi:hypothetical protein
LAICNATLRGFDCIASDANIMRRWRALSQSSAGAQTFRVTGFAAARAAPFAATEEQQFRIPAGAATMSAFCHSLFGHTVIAKNNGE